MDKNSIVKAEILSQALPYIQKYNNKIVVIKYGGNAMINEELKMNVINDVVLLSEIGVKVILVHGGGPEISGTLKKMNKESKFIHGLRYTDDETIDVVQMVLAGKTNKDLVKLIMQSGGNAVGISGIDNQLIVAKKHECEDDLGYVGDIDKINPNIILDMLEKGYIPVIASVGTDEEGHTYNINADTAAAEIAGALSAENMILVSDIPGLLFDKDDESTLIPLVHVYEVKGLEDKGIISGGMIPKVECCVRAIRQNVKKAVIIDGRIPHSILIEMLSKEGIGTMFKR
ncbi:MAG: acetylglutamate kinase [Longibaculum muris]|uniref:Acetylglutamate kinase n=1 Tax=Longibaculum muris TaxID=1796628 RepID=A0A4R3Z6H1_9FIRM|nr:acetylglutamate kinase [Longibaculum muris]KXU49921.1 acetylglutamate kinase [Candidatus Stoquefichus sp. KLE1796]MBS5368112.1 acetylglutamate kinase [Coprobacillus cateniformis]MCR1887526.1 acetylglutamate kinase [Longibaculum muris]MED9811756.1 acetylglutamate kinase [Longibaculum muris]TCW00756.1 N-acetylglutamate kinase [Longibaculum muris]